MTILGGSIAAAAAVFFVSTVALSAECSDLDSVREASRDQFASIMGSVHSSTFVAETTFSMTSGKCEIDDPKTDAPKYRCSWFFDQKDAMDTFFQDFVDGVLRCVSFKDRKGADIATNDVMLEDGVHSVELSAGHYSRHWYVDFTYR